MKIKKNDLSKLEDQIKTIKLQLFKAEEILSRLMEAKKLSDLDDKLK